MLRFYEDKFKISTDFDLNEFWVEMLSKFMIGIVRDSEQIFSCLMIRHLFLHLNMPQLGMKDIQLEERCMKLKIQLINLVHRFDDLKHLISCTLKCLLDLLCLIQFLMLLRLLK